MTENERFNTIIGELAELLKAKNDTISLQKWQIAGLEARLDEAEYNLAPLGNAKPKNIETRG